MRIGMPYRKSRQQSQMRENNVNLSTKGSGIVELSPIYLGDMMGHMLSPTLRETINIQNRENANQSARLDSSRHLNERSRMTKQSSQKSDNFAQTLQVVKQTQLGAEQLQSSEVSFKDQPSKKIKSSAHESSVGNSADGRNLVKEIEMIAQTFPKNQKIDIPKLYSQRRPILSPVHIPYTENDTETSKEMDVGGWSKSI